MIRKEHLDKCVGHWVKARWVAGHETLEAEGFLKKGERTYHLHVSSSKRYDFGIKQVKACKIVK